VGEKKGEKRERGDGSTKEDPKYVKMR